MRGPICFCGLITPFSLRLLTAILIPRGEIFAASRSHCHNYYVLLRHYGSKTYSSIHTHAVIHANTSSKKTQKDKNSKTVKRNRTDKTHCLGLMGSSRNIKFLYRRHVGHFL